MPAARVIGAAALNRLVVTDRETHSDRAISPIFPVRPCDNAGAVQAAALAVVEKEAGVPLLTGRQQRSSGMHLVVVEDCRANIPVDRLGIGKCNPAVDN